VVGTERVFAAGDITSFPVKQGGLAAQQAVAAAHAIASYAGVASAPEPFRPVLRGLLMTGSGTLYLRRDLVGERVAEWASSAPLGWPAGKIVGRRLAALLAAAASPA
jgi:sulfide:quinone oxidoreductase